MNKKDKLLTLSGGRKFVVVEQCEYNGNYYFFANEIINDSISDNYKIFTITTNGNNQEIIHEITDDETVKNICKIIDEKTDND